VPPANRLALFCLEKLLFGATSLIGKTLAGEVEALMLRLPGVRHMLNGLARIERESRGKEVLKDRLLEELRQMTPAGGAPPDPTASLDVVTALYQHQKLDALHGDVRKLFDLMQDSVASMLTDIDARHNEPVLTWPMQESHDADTRISDIIQYNSGAYDFVGRDAELDILLRFLGEIGRAGPKARFSWLLITGAGGEGKSRLGLEFTRIAERDHGWKAGRLSLLQLKKNFDPFRWRPRQPTCMVIDYPAQDPDAVHGLLAALDQNADDFDWPVRVLLLERTTEGEWFRKLLPPDSDDRLLREHAFVLNGRRLDGGLPLAPVSPTALVGAMKARFVSQGQEPPEDALLLAAAARIDPRPRLIDGAAFIMPRPLFAMAAAEAILLARGAGEGDDDAIVGHLDREKVLARIIERDRIKRWAIANLGTAHDLDLHENLFALITACLGLPETRLHDLPPHVRDWLPDLRPKASHRLDRNLLGAMTRKRETGPKEPSGGAAWSGLEPDILGEFYFLDRLAQLRSTDPDAAQALIDGAFAIGGADASQFFLRCAVDFTSRFTVLGGMAPTPAAGRSGVLAYGDVSLDLSYRAATGTELIVAAESLTNFQRLAAAFSCDRAIGLAEARVAVNVIGKAGTAGDWDRVDGLLDRFDRLRLAFPDEREIALMEAQGAVNVIGKAGTAGNWDRVDGLLDRFDRLRLAFPDDREIALGEAQGSFNVIGKAGTAGDWDRVDGLLGRFDRLRLAFPDEREIAVGEAKGAVNVIGEAGTAGDWDRVDGLLDRFDRQRHAFPDDREFALLEAQGAVNVIGKAGTAGDWDRVGGLLDRFDRLRHAFPDDREIALEEAKGAVNVIGEAGTAGDWDRVDGLLARVNALSECFPDHPPLQPVAAAGVVLAYWGRRSMDQDPDKVATELAFFAAHVRIQASLSEGGQFLFAESLQVLKDAGTRFPNSDGVSGVLQGWTKAGVDFEQVPPIGRQ
jgi:hypothetical protein